MAAHTESSELPSATTISPSLTIQPPLSRRGKGPGIILVLDHYALLQNSDKHIDPPPLQKWAEEGYAVAQVLVPGKAEDGGEFPLDRAVRALKEMEECDGGEKGFALVSYLSRIPFYVEEAVCIEPTLKAIISYGGRKFSPISTTVSTLPPQLIHSAGHEKERRESLSIVPDSNVGESKSRVPAGGHLKTYRYVDAPKDSQWVLPADDTYHAASAKLAHSRSLAFLKLLLNGPFFDLEAVWDEHCNYEFVERDVERTMATMIAQPYVNHIPTMTGGVGKERLSAFYTHYFVFANPKDTAMQLVSRTVGVDKLVDEFVFEFTHDKVMHWLLPGVPPTFKFLRIPFTSIITFRGDRLSHEHISWDQATALHQAGLLPEWTTFPYAIDGREAAERKRFEVRLPVVSVDGANKLVEEGSVESNELITRNEGRGWREVDNI